MRSLLGSTFVLYFCVTFAIQLLEVPLVRLFESAICDRYHRSVVGASIHAFGDTDEASCKIVIVQDELANVVGWKVAFDAFPGILLRDPVLDFVSELTSTCRSFDGSLVRLGGRSLW
jgi:hypothetical protein